MRRRPKAVNSCAIIVTEANVRTKPIHDRMPVTLSREVYDAWMDPRSAGSPTAESVPIRHLPCRKLHGRRGGETDVLVCDRCRRVTTPAQRPDDSTDVLGRPTTKRHESRRGYASALRQAGQIPIRSHVSALQLALPPASIAIMSSVVADTPAAVSPFTPKPDIQRSTENESSVAAASQSHERSGLHMRPRVTPV